VDEEDNRVRLSSCRLPRRSRRSSIFSVRSSSRSSAIFLVSKTSRGRNVKATNRHGRETSWRRNVSIQIHLTGGDFCVEVEQCQRMAWYSMIRPRGELVLSDNVFCSVIVVAVSCTDTEPANVVVSEWRRADQRHGDVTVQPRCAGGVRPVMFTLHDTVFHQVTQKHDLPTPASCSS